MKKIRIPSKTYGTHCVLVDDEDFEWVSIYRWHLKKVVSRTSGDVSFYAETHVRKELGGQRTLQMQRLILGLDFGDKRYVDHINYKTLDNRRCNLRTCSPLESVRHRRKWQDTSSRYKGVCYSRIDKNWVSYIKVDGRRVSLGRFKTEKEAAIQYDIAANAEFKEFADLNFPESDYSKDMFDIKKYRTPDQKSSSSKFIGVSWKKSNRNWTAQIEVDKKSVHLGCFENETDAAKAYDNYVIKHKLKRRLNNANSSPRNRQ